MLSHRYVIPLDSDDLLTFDCVRIMTSALRAAGFPLLAYSDEDKVLEGHLRDPYCKPDFDPVLFTHSCYTSHLCAIDREAALRFSCYTNGEVEGSSDWDSFTLFLLEGHLPLHVPEILYTWRMHSRNLTALDIDSKDYIHESQLAVFYAYFCQVVESMIDTQLTSRHSSVAHRTGVLFATRALHALLLLYCMARTRKLIHWYLRSTVIASNGSKRRI